MSADVASRIALIVSSCDAFCDTWRPFAYFFAKFWPDCPFKTYLIVNQLEVVSDILEPLAVGPDRGWASNFRRVLERIPHDYILYLQDDYFLNSPVDTPRIVADCAWAMEHDADSLCFRGYPEPQTGYRPLTEQFGFAASDSDGRTRCQFALWKKTALMQVLQEGESAWEMESKGSERTREMDILVYARRADAPIRYLSSAIVRGLWVPEAIEMCAREGIPIQPRVRGVYRPGQKMKKVRRAVSRLALRLWLASRRGRPIDLRRESLKR
ncbi:MAG: hypothetical protein ACJ8KU_07710 [Chthoniobacterales bacterium]|jgi:hypothetical protein